MKLLKYLAVVSVIYVFQVLSNCQEVKTIFFQVPFCLKTGKASTEQWTCWQHMWFPVPRDHDSFQFYSKTICKQRYLIHYSYLDEWSQTVCFCYRINNYLMPRVLHHGMRKIPSWKCILNSINCKCITITLHCKIWCFSKNEFSTIIQCYSHTSDLIKWSYQIISFILFYFNKTESYKPSLNNVITQTIHHFKTF